MKHRYFIFDEDYDNLESDADISVKIKRTIDLIMSHFIESGFTEKTLINTNFILSTEKPIVVLCCI